MTLLFYCALYNPTIMTITEQYYSTVYCSTRGTAVQRLLIFFRVSAYGSLKTKKKSKS